MPLQAVWTAEKQIGNGMRFKGVEWQAGAQRTVAELSRADNKRKESRLAADRTVMSEGMKHKK